MFWYWVVVVKQGLALGLASMTTAISHIKGGVVIPSRGLLKIQHFSRVHDYSFKNTFQCF